MASDSVKIKMHSPYKHFIKHWAQEGEDYIECYNDHFVTEAKGSDNCIALLVEPRPLQPSVYDFMEAHYDRFKYVFTHDSILLEKLPNAKLIIWGGVWSWGNEEKDFSHPISMVASHKGQAPTRIERRNLAFELQGKVDCYGTFNGGAFVSTDTIYGKYPFSIVIENYIDDWWITEKICNCFSHKTIPIYYGARKIDELFNPKGIIHAYSVEEIKGYVDSFKYGGDPRILYNTKLDAVEDNYIRVKKYENFDTWFFNEYEKLLEGLVV